MANDDFLKDFQAAPSPEFGENLLTKLRQLDEEENNEIAATKKSPLLVLAPRRRSPERHLSWIASLALLFLFSSILLFNIQDAAPDNSTGMTLARLSGLNNLAWSPDGRLLYVSDESYLYRLNLRLQLVDAWPLAMDGTVTAMLFAEDRLLLGDSTGNLSLWDSQTMQKLETLPIHDGALELLAYLPDHQIILSSGADGALVSLRLSGRQIQEQARVELGTAVEIRGLAVHPNETQIIATSSNAVSLIYELRENGALVANSAYSMSSFPPTAQADYLLNGQFMLLAWWDSLRVVDSQTLAERYHYTLPEAYLWLDPLSIQQNRLLLLNPNGLLGFWDFDKEQYLEIFRSSSNHPLKAALHPEGQLIAAISLADEVRLWRIDNLSDGGMSSSEVAVNRPSHNQPSTTVPLSLAPLAGDLSQVRELYHFGDGYLLETRWSPDGSLLMVSSTSTIRLYDANLGFLREWSVLGMDLSGSAFSPDGRYLLTGTETGMLAVWDVLTGRNLSSLSMSTEALQFIAFLNGGSRVLSRDASGEFFVLSFDGRQLSLEMRSEQAALANWTIQDWQADGNHLQILMARPSPLDFSTTGLINLIELSLDDEIRAETASTGINGHLARFISDGRIIIYEEREQRLDFYASEGMTWLDSFDLAMDTATLNHLLYDAAHEQVLLIDYDRSISTYDLELGAVQLIENTRSLLENTAQSFALHPNGEVAAVISSHNRIALWQFGASGIEEIANDSPVLGQIRTFVSASSNIAAASTSEGAVLLFDSITGNLLRRLDLETWGQLNHDLLFSPDGQLLAVLGQDETGADSRLTLIDVQAAIDGNPDFLFGGFPYIFENEYLAGMAFDVFGDSLYTGGARLRRWSLFNESMITGIEMGELRGLNILAHHPRFGEIASLRTGNYLLVLETANMENRYLTRHYGRSMPANTFLEYSPNGRWLIVVGDAVAPRIFDTQTGELLVSLEHLGTDTFNSMALSAETIFLASEQGIFVINWLEAVQNPQDFSFITLPYNAKQIALSADNQRLFYLGNDGMVRVLGLPEN